MKDCDDKFKKAVWLDENISLETNNFNPSNTTVIRCLTLLMFLFSVVVTLNATIKMPFNIPIFVCTVLFAVFFTFINDLKKYKGYAVLGSILLLITAVFLLRKILLHGVEIICTNFIDVFNLYYSTNYMLYEFNFAHTFDYQKTKIIFIIFLIYILSMFFSSLITRKKSILTMTIVLSFLLWSATNFGREPHVISILLILFTFMSVYALESQQNRRLQVTSKGEFSKNEKRKCKYYFYNLDKFQSGVINRNWISVVALSTSIIIAIMLIFPQGSYKPNEKAKKISDDPAGFITGVWDSIPKPELFDDFLGMSKSGVGGGDLTSIDRKGFNQVTHLKISAELSSPMLLKGYVGSVYSSERWSDLSQSVYNKNAEVFSNLEKLGIHPQTLLSNYINSLTDINLGENKITVENIKANKKYAYVPENIKNIISNENPFVKDTIVDGKAYIDNKFTFATDYAISVGSNANPNYKPEVKSALSAYEKFVFDNYLQIPNGRFESLKNDFPMVNDIFDFNDTTKTFENLNEKEVFLKVNKYLADHAVYDLAPGKTPKDKDYIEYFLYENHKGYCTHFATAATMIFRSMGIPARYVEGYTVTLNDYQNNRTDDGKIDIKDSNAHAWTEIYVPSYGWISIDVTPGFSNNSIAPPISNVTVPDSMKTSSQASSSALSEVSSEVSSKSQSSTTSAVSSNASSEIEKVSGDSSSSKMSNVLIVFLLFFGMILAFFLLLGLRHAVVSSKQKSSFNQKDVNKSIVNVYAYILKILSFIGYNKVENETEIEFATRVTSVCNFISNDTFINITQLTLKARFSNHTIDMKRLQQVSEFSNELNVKVYDSLKFAEKFKYWLIDNLK